MRNKYPGPCRECGQTVEVGAGYFERHRGGWRVRCIPCTARGKVAAGNPIDTLTPPQRAALRQEEKP